MRKGAVIRSGKSGHKECKTGYPDSIPPAHPDFPVRQDLPDKDRLQEFYKDSLPDRCHRSVVLRLL
ncbi:hypothetical protein CHA01nite_15260 [Chryseobacterium hagamense]|uniref:Uncharacterized protein n=1 Tax=Chryseobacterium hagamense TaxID=395935 RepID=A0A511YKV4_9FLAO|nr:hypothetical protein CHA01nite_15260 [Chryseobacterium hagamense]